MDSVFLRIRRSMRFGNYKARSKRRKWSFRRRIRMYIRKKITEAVVRKCIGM